MIKQILSNFYNQLMSQINSLKFPGVEIEKTAWEVDDVEEGIGRKSGILYSSYRTFEKVIIRYVPENVSACFIVSDGEIQGNVGEIASNLETLENIADLAKKHSERLEMNQKNAGYVIPGETEEEALWRLHCIINYTPDEELKTLTGDEWRSRETTGPANNPNAAWEGWLQEWGDEPFVKVLEVNNKRSKTGLYLQCNKTVFDDVKNIIHERDPRRIKLVWVKC